MFTLTKWIAIGYGLLAGASFVLDSPGIVIIPVATLSIMFFALGIAVFPKRSAKFALHWPGIPSEENIFLVIDGTPYPILGYEQELVLLLTVRNGFELLVTIGIALLSLYGVLTGTFSVESMFQGALGPFLGTIRLEFLCAAGAMVLLMNVRWCEECFFLRGSYCALADILGHEEGFRNKGTRYQFFDHTGERRGGYGPFWTNAADTVSLAFYDPKAPDRNTAHSALFFHKCTLVDLIPKRNRQVN